MDLDLTQVAPRSAVRFNQLNGALGAEVENLDLSQPLSDADFKSVRNALVRYQVLVFRDQDILLDQQIAFGRDVSGRAADGNHTALSGGAGARRRHDVRQHDCRLSWSVARHAEVCARACGLARFQTVSHSFRLGAGACAKLRALEDRFPNPWHPVVRVHPDTGCRSLFVNPQFTVRLRGVKEDESVTMLNYLYRQAAVPENQLRVKWRPNTVVIWDNRSVQHYAVHDYYPQSRTMDRITIAGDAPVGVAGPYMPEAPFDHHPALTTGVRASARPARQFERG